MGWKDRFWSAYGTVVDTAIDITAKTLNTVGSLACMAGGAGFAMSYAVDETLSATYSASGNALGSVVLQAELHGFPYAINETISFQDFLQHSDGTTFNLKNYFPPDTIKIASAILFSSGTALRLLGDNIKQWQQGRVDTLYFRQHHRIDVSPPAIKEYLHASAKSITGSLSYGCLSSAIVGKVFNARISPAEYSVTYPLNGTHRANGTYYQGPVNELPIPVDYFFSKNISIDFFAQPFLVTVGARINAMINASYGGGLFLQPAYDQKESPVLIPGVIGGGALLANSIFSRKVVQLRDERILKAVDDAGIYLRI
ncbi:hypothetical protein [Legionella fallonii]|uniref:Uncharacterized protein n=1 Tax=Legionella fallonii LLAP-10 TaxID=1212491 RepID=A0A098G6L4_9GAMM|nr:hypothetical protein [Legionella fallonii]CEG58092.1 conserved protein of unknown function [Legionella fallonii LLAP-10]